MDTIPDVAKSAKPLLIAGAALEVRHQAERDANEGSDNSRQTATGSWQKTDILFTESQPHAARCLPLAEKCSVRHAFSNPQSVIRNPQLPKCLLLLVTAAGNTGSGHRSSI
jgi:hypothetical protein